MEFVPSKLYYKIGEVCEIVGVEAHVLRFWETEFPSLTPPKSKNGQRTYRPGDIELIIEIRKLLYEDGYTIAGARKRIKMNAAAKKQQTPEKKAQPSVSVPKPVKPPRPEFLPLFDFALDKAEVTVRAGYGGNFVETGGAAAPKPAVMPQPKPGIAALSKPGVTTQPKPGVPAQPKTGVPAQPKTGVPAQPKTGANFKPPVMERLKIAQKELENILTLLDHE